MFRMISAALCVLFAPPASAAQPAEFVLPGIAAIERAPSAFSVPAPSPARRGFDCLGPLHWRGEISAFLNEDAHSFPPAGGILFMGSSSIRMWDLKRYFPDLPVINRGFGGSCIGESVYYFDRIAAPYRPRLIVLYAGDNDIAASHSPEETAADFERFAAAAEEQLPDAELIYLSIKPSPARWPLWPAMRAANGLLRASCAVRARCRFADVSSAMLGPDGSPRPELFHPGDGLHMSDQGYRLWADILDPLLRAP